jgi:hypothetical protein
MSGQIGTSASLSGQTDPSASLSGQIGPSAGCCGKTKSGKSCKWRSTTAFNGSRYCKHHMPRVIENETASPGNGKRLELKLELSIETIRMLGGNKCEFVFCH